ncbi:MAG: SsrA-binding protein SmpB [Pseudomonadota bacterium]
MSKPVAVNRRAFFDYQIEQTLQVGLVLVGSEVKSLRESGVSLKQSFVATSKGALWLQGAHIAPYKPAHRFNHEPTRPRKVLLKRREMQRLQGLTARRGYTLVPLRLFFNARGWAKLEIGLGRGKTQVDKRETIKRREWDRDQRRLLKTRS